MTRYNFINILIILFFSISNLKAEVTGYPRSKEEAEEYAKQNQSYDFSNQMDVSEDDECYAASDVETRKEGEKTIYTVKTGAPVIQGQLLPPERPNERPSQLVPRTAICFSKGQKQKVITPYRPKQNPVSTPPSQPKDPSRMLIRKNAQFFMPPHSSDSQSNTQGGSSSGEMENPNSPVSNPLLQTEKLKMIQEVLAQYAKCNARLLSLKEKEGVFPVTQQYIKCPMDDPKQMDRKSFILHLLEIRKTAKATLFDLISEIMAWSDPKQIYIYKLSLGNGLRSFSSFCLGATLTLEEAVKFRLEAQKNPSRKDENKKKSGGRFSFR